MSRKPRILHVGEAPYLATGYAVYAREVLSRLHESGKYDVGMLGCYGEFDDPRRLDIPYAYFNNMPDPGDPRQMAEYSANGLNQFGAWKFEEACLAFRPDIVFDIRDWWMASGVESSPLRRFFHWAYMPTVDSEPQDEQWLATFANADAIFTYTDWAAEVLRRECGDTINYVGTAPPGADTRIFAPLEDKRAFKRAMGLPDNALVVGMVARNQSRKLYPDLITSFAKLPERLRGNTYLLIHARHPDVGWDLPRLVKEAGIGSRTLFTYACESCGQSYPSFYSDALAVCRACGNLTATLPGTNQGISTEMLARVMNLMDVYVQYANCLALGTEVLLKQGWTAIENVRVGDLAFTHRGNWKPVVKVFQHNRGDRPLDIRLCGDFETLTVTSEHPILGIRKHGVAPCNKHSLREYLGVKLKNGGECPPPEFANAGEYRPKDMVAYFIDDTVFDKSMIDLGSHVSEPDVVGSSTVDIKWGGSYPRYIEVDNLFCRFLGLYVADGTATCAPSNKSVRVTNNESDVENIQLAMSVLGRWINGRPFTNPYEGRKAVDVAIYSKPHSQMMLSLCKKGTHKQLPDWVMYLPTEKQMEVLRGLFMGDGHYMVDRDASVYSTTSLVLARQMKQLFRRLRINFGASIADKPAPRKRQYRFEVKGNVAQGLVVSGRTKTQSLYSGQWHLMQIKEIAPSAYKGDVCNFEVADDNSYMTHVGVVHNSEGFGMSQVEAAACGVPVMAVDYSAMSDVVRKLHGTPIKVLHLLRESATHSYRAVPDNDDFIAKLVKLLELPEPMRLRMGWMGRCGVLEHYTYEKTAQVWMDHFDQVTSRPWEETWDSPAKLVKPKLPIPDNLSNIEWAKYGWEHVAGRPDWANGYAALRMARELTWQRTSGGMGGLPFNDASAIGLGLDKAAKRFTREDALKQLLQVAEQWNHWERKRVASR